MKPDGSRTALVTGAASGIGAALVRALLEEGCVVTAADRDAAGLAALAAAGCREGGLVGPKAVERLRTVVTDVRDAEQVREAVAQAREATGALDLLLNNAGVGLAGEVRDLSLEDWHRVVDVNFWGVVHGVRAAYPAMLARRSGHIVNTASPAGLCPRPGMAPYSAAKHAVVGLSLSLRGEAAAHGVKVSVVCPGHVRTGIFDAAVYRGVDRAGLLAAVPTRGIEPELCARRILAGVRRNRAVILIGGVHRAEWWLQRFAPGLARGVSGLRARAFRRHRRAESPSRSPDAPGPSDSR